MQRREYEISKIVVNGRVITKVIIDPHVDKHLDHISDELILKLVQKLDNQEYPHEADKDGFKYFSSIVSFQENKYKMVWLLEDHCFFIGVITVFKDRRL